MLQSCGRSSVRQAAASKAGASAPVGSPEEELPIVIERQPLTRGRLLAGGLDRLQGACNGQDRAKRSSLHAPPIVAQRAMKEFGFRTNPAPLGLDPQPTIPDNFYVHRFVPLLRFLERAS
jgi:hypothetical protein